MEELQKKDVPADVINTDNNVKIKTDTDSKVIETDNKLYEFSFFETDDDNNHEQGSGEQDEDDVVDRIFAAAKGGQTKDLSKLIFSSGKGNSVEDKKKKRISFPLKRKSSVDSQPNILSKKIQKTDLQKFVNFKDIQNSIKPLTRIADETGRFVIGTQKSLPILRQTEEITSPGHSGISKPVPLKLPKAATSKQSNITTAHRPTTTAQIYVNNQSNKNRSSQSNENSLNSAKGQSNESTSNNEDSQKIDKPLTKDVASADTSTSKQAAPSIDFDVLTNAITNLLEDCISKNKKSSIKLVLYCDDKPLHSFSILETASPDSQGKDAEVVKSSECCENSGESPSTGENKKTESLNTDHINPASSVNEISNFTNIIDNKTKTRLHDKIKQNENLKSVGAPDTLEDLLNETVIKQEKEDDGYDLANKSGSVKIVSVNKVAGNSNTASKTVNANLLGQSETVTEKRQEIKSPSDAIERLFVEKSDDFTIYRNDDEDELEEVSLKIVENLENTSSNSQENNNSEESGDNRQKPFQCGWCHKRFRYERNLGIHRRSIHGILDDVDKTTEPETSQEDSPAKNSSPSKSKLNPSLDEFLEKEVAKLKDKGKVQVSEKDLVEDSGAEESEELETNSPNKFVVKKERVDFTDIDDSVSEAEKEFINLLLNKNQDATHGYAKSSPKIVSLQNLANWESQGQRFPIDPVFVCEHCGKFYHSRKSMKDHFIREHATEAGQEPLYVFIQTDNYSCPICFKPFPNPYTLVAHAKTHTKDKELKCAICDKEYSSVHILRRHIDTIHADVRPRPFKCRFCDYAAENRWHLKEHQRRHTGEQPYQCPICLKTFSHQGTMNRHCKVTHKVIPGAPKRLFYPGANPDAELSHVSLPDKTDKNDKIEQPASVPAIIQLSNVGDPTRINLSFIPIQNVADIKKGAKKRTKRSKGLKVPQAASSLNANPAETSTSTQEQIGIDQNQDLSSSPEQAKIQENSEPQVQVETDTDADQLSNHNAVIGPEGELVIIKQEPVDND